MSNIQEVGLKLRVDGEIISDLHPKVTQKDIIHTIKNLKANLESSGISKNIIHNIFDVSIEMLQNILKYSYANKIDSSKVREALGEFIISYNRLEDTVKLYSSNLVSKDNITKINKRIDEIRGLSNKELRRLLRSKMRSKKNLHENGSGLGFTTISIASTSPIIIDFVDSKKYNNLATFMLEVHI